MMGTLGMISLQAGVATSAAPPQGFGVFLIATVVKMLVVFTIYLVGVAMLTLAERKVSAWIQGRVGPNRVGYGGLLQPAADGLKNIMKEETYPGAVNKPLFILAPAIAFCTALIAWAVIPFAAPWESAWGLISMALAPLPIGFLYILAITSLGVYGIVLAGWASNNKYALLGGLRSSAQMVSYEIALGMSTIPVLLLAGNVAMDTIIQQQALHGWNVLNLTLAFFVFLVAGFAETNRLPFDLPEAEAELVAGYHSEYSAMKFSMFFIAEYANMVTMSALMATLFFGGWDIPFTLWDNVAPHTGLKSLLTGLLFLGKIMFFIFTFMWVRWTLPRFRYDQLMSLGWKVLLPMMLLYIIIVATAVLVFRSMGLEQVRWFGVSAFGLSLFLMNIVVSVLVFALLDRGRVISPASTRLRDDALERRRARRFRSTLSAEAGD
jgi:NADH-quinone oxidoreductase subunit H